MVVCNYSLATFSIQSQAEGLVSPQIKTLPENCWIHSVGHKTLVVYAETEGNYTNNWALAVAGISILIVNR